MTWVVSDFSPETMEAKDLGITSLRDWKKKLSIHNLLPRELSFRNENEIKTLSDEKKKMIYF